MARKDAPKAEVVLVPAATSDGFFSYVVDRYLASASALANLIVLADAGIIAAAWTVLQTAEPRPVAKTLLLLTIALLAVSLWCHLFYVYNTKRYSFGLILAAVKTHQPDKETIDQLQRHYTAQLPKFSAQMARYGWTSSRSLAAGAIVFFIAALLVYVVDTRWEKRIVVVAAPTLSSATARADSVIRTLQNVRELSLDLHTDHTNSSKSYAYVIRYEHRR